MTAFEIALLAGGGLVAGTVNTLAGAGSLLTVPVLVLIGLPGNVANGTNRLGLLLQNLVAMGSFRAEGISARGALPVLVPVALGSLAGALWVSRLADDTFERLFGLLMLVLLVPVLRQGVRSRASPPAPWSRGTTAAVFFAIGLYGGSFQAGSGLLLLFALSRAGFDLVRANAIKVTVIAALTAVAVPVFLAAGQIELWPALVLAAGFSVGGALGARIAVRGGERVIRPVLAVAVFAMAGRMLGFY